MLKLSIKGETSNNRSQILESKVCLTCSRDISLPKMILWGLGLHHRAFSSPNKITPEQSNRNSTCRSSRRTALKSKRTPSNSLIQNICLRTSSSKHNKANRIWSEKWNVSGSLSGQKLEVDLLQEPALSKITLTLDRTITWLLTIEGALSTLKF
jgi:hypothetical protein